MIGGERPLRLTSNPGDCCPAWSPDARSVAYARGHPGGRTIYVVPALGGTSRELYSEEGDLPTDRPTALVFVGPERQIPGGQRALYTRKTAHHHSRLIAGCFQIAPHLTPS